MKAALQKYDAFVFDLDGTLVDSVPDLCLALNHGLSECGLDSVSEAQVRQWVGNGSQKLVERALLSFGESFCQYQDALHQQFLKSYAQFLNQESQLYPDTIALLNELKSRNKTLALLTNKPIQFVEPLLRSLNIVEYFELLVGGDSLAEKKPSPLPLIHVLDSLKVQPEQTLMIGDSRSDVLCAQAADVDCVLLAQGYNQGVDLASLAPTFLFDDTPSFLAHLSA